MKMLNKKGTMGKRFHKLVSHIVDKQSPVASAEMSTEEQADSVDQQKKKAKQRPIDPNPRNYK